MSDLRSRDMSSQQATQARPAAPGRVAAFLEENGLVVVVLGAFAIVLVVALRKDLVVDGWMDRAARPAVTRHPHGLDARTTLERPAVARSARAVWVVAARRNQARAP